jgi:DNA-binding protein H-NS
MTTRTAASILQQIAELQAEYDAIARKDRSAVIASIREIRMAFSITDAELSPSNKPTRRPSIKCRNGDNQWNGVGRNPEWMRAMINIGRSKSEFLISELL